MAFINLADNGPIEDMGAMIVEVTVSGAKLPELNGPYVSAGTYNMASKYQKRGLFLGKRLTIYRSCRETWVIACVPENAEPNPTDDIDFFYTYVEPFNSNSLGNNPNLPPERGWIATELMWRLRAHGSFPRVSPTFFDVDADDLGQVGGFPVVEVRQGGAAFGSSCVLCRDDFEERQVCVLLPCSHCYHRGCFDGLFPRERDVPSHIRCPHCQGLHQVNGR